MLEATVLDRLSYMPAVAILGARQVGKTTLAHSVVKTLGRDSITLDLEDSDDLALLADPKPWLLSNAHKLVVIDEVQRLPELFPLLRTLIDRDRRPGRFLLLGSSSPVIIHRTAESLAGRIAYLDLYPLSVSEVSNAEQSRLWFRGGYPDAFLAPSDARAIDTLNALIRTFIDRDLRLLGLAASPNKVEGLLRMLSSVHGQVLNMNMLGKSLGLTGPTIRNYVDFFSHSYMVFLLPSYHVNIRKRLTKAPKIYFTDPGVLHAIAGVRSADSLHGNVLFGHSWEGFVIQQVRARYGKDVDLHYFRTQDGSELDLVITQGIQPVAAVEIKSTNSPSLGKGNRFAFEAVNAPLQLICTPSAEDHLQAKDIQVCSLGTIFMHLDKVVR